MCSPYALADQFLDADLRTCRTGLRAPVRPRFSRFLPRRLLTILATDSYAAGATVQILLFAMNAAKSVEKRNLALAKRRCLPLFPCRIKLNAPKAHTFLEVIRVRWGKAAHIVFMFYALATCLLVSAMLVTGGSATVTVR